ncbi:unnamed protein product [Eruca vesicaria subsp. sativa]|uniref:Uncharacterized protein n=1 Tax=Eruca vesicaria subsp. sativa TaxID=29727 RepID=A0ABC8L329_ERUVS|nr:unnamed protein product [Eruca vesicaria subsp. sativa]
MQETTKDYKKSILPKHAGLNIIDIRNAEHDPELKVQPMLELSTMGGEEWIPFDDERMDHEVAYMAGKIEKGRVFRKTDWGGGDMRVELYVHGGVKKKKRRVGERVDVVECDGEGPSMNQGGDGHSGGCSERPVDIVVARLTLEVETLKNEIVLLKKTVRSLVRRVGRRRGRKRDSVRKQGVASQQGGGSPHGGGSERDVDGGEDRGGSQQGVGSPNNQVGDDGSDELHLMREEVVAQKSGDDDSFSSDEAPRLLVRMKQGDGIPLQWADGGRPSPDGNVLYDGTTSNTYFVADSQVGLGGGGPLGVLANVNPLSYVDGQDSSFVADDIGGRSPGNKLTVEDAERLDVVVQGYIGTSEATASKSGPEIFVAGSNTYVDFGVLQEQTSANLVAGAADAVTSHDNQRVDSDPMTPKETSDGGDDTRAAVPVEGSESGPVGEQRVVSDPMTPKDTIDGGDDTIEALAVEGREMVYCDALTPKNPNVGGDEETVSATVDESVAGTVGDQVTVSRPDSCFQTCEASKKDTVQVGLEVGPSVLIEPRRPDPYEVPEIVPTVEDCDYPAFIKVLESAQEAVHAKAGGKDDLNNKFFIDLATSQDMLSDKVR